ncbi:hypothetical protein ACH5RR_030350 [Cinchona calisaya]|uniref:Uncharacterized protein n=1 Tax=Cinchona calisaya TaxID=153742 RepID=A0ABD2YVQ2_9GENT
MDDYSGEEEWIPETPIPSPLWPRTEVKFIQIGPDAVAIWGKILPRENSLADIEAAIKYTETKNSDQETDENQNEFLIIPDLELGMNVAPACQEMTPHWVRMRDLPHWIRKSVRAHFDYHKFWNHSYNLGVPQVCFRATNSAFASPSSNYEVAINSAFANPTEVNYIILGITGQAAVALVSSSSSDSPFLHCFVAATGIGFLGSFFAHYVVKNPKIARILSKIGAIGASSAVIVTLGLYLPKDTKWNLNVVATAVACLATGVAVASA